MSLDGDAECTRQMVGRQACSVLPVGRPLARWRRDSEADDLPNVTDLVYLAALALNTGANYVQQRIAVRTSARQTSPSTQTLHRWPDDD
ncbi:hypothetical protein [Burkholderia seminalis]|uniref:hypothetical protein n=1 Tax=Burkholderia seminalis TaxID=488731 RepID=UPI00158D17C1|nr:hypothetical protein [Burkholderia seminalis]